jgi:hypothetical protein
MRTHRFSYGMALAILCALHLAFVCAVAVDLAYNAGHSGLGMGELWDALRGGAPMARASGTTISRAFNMLVSMVLTSVAIAIPITASFYTPRLIEIFITDRVNVTVLTFFVVSAAGAIFSPQMTWEAVATSGEAVGFFPRVALWVSFELMLVGWSLLIPYFYYVFRYLEPETIIDRLTQRAYSQLDQLRRRPARDMRAQQAELAERVQNLGSTVLRAIDRADRDVALDAIGALQRLTLRYMSIKGELPDAWYTPERDRFLGLSRSAFDLIVTQHTWVEHLAQSQLLLAYKNALTKLPDTVSALSNVARTLANEAEQRKDDAVLQLSVRFVNSYLRSAIHKSDVHAIFDVLYVYRELARELVHSRPDTAARIAEHMHYYAQFARLKNIQFACDLSAHEVYNVMQEAYANDMAVAPDLLDTLLRFQVHGATTQHLKTLLMAGGFFVRLGARGEAPLARLRDALSVIERNRLEGALDEIERTKDPVFWEVTDRQTNIDFALEHEREAMRRFLGELPQERDP